MEVSEAQGEKEADGIESTNFSSENSESEFEILSEDDEVTLSFTELLEDASADDLPDMGGAVSDQAVEGGRKRRSNSRLLHATDLLVAAFQMRLEHLVMNIADYPPALTFVK